MINTKVKEIIASITGIADPDFIKTKMSLRDYLNMEEDEIEILLEAVEAEWDLDLLSYVSDLETVGDVIAYIESQL